jgi:hypothetical protein
MRFEGQEFRGRELVLDGNVYVRCTIVGCLLRYSGTTEINLSECRMGSNEFSYDGQAANTVRALQALARSGGGGLDHVMRLFLTDAPVDWHRLAEIVHLPVVPDEPQESR